MPSIRLVLLLFASAVLVSSCGSKANRAVTDKAGPRAALNAAGEPQWSVQLRGDQMRFSTGEAAATVVKATRQDQGAKGVTWSGATPAAPGKAALQLSLLAVRKPCQDGSTGLTYPLTATVQLAGVRYAGCAAPAGQGLGPPS